MNRVIVFTRTKHGANQVAEHLSRTGVVAEAIHGNKSQNARQRALDMFRPARRGCWWRPTSPPAASTLTTSRHVVNFELPNEPESYVHRIGRTARAGGEGIAISFCDARNAAICATSNALIRMKIEVVAHDLPELTEEQRRQMEEPRRPHGHRHGGKPQVTEAGGHKGGGHKPGGGATPSGDAADGHDPHAPKKRNGSRPHWHRGTSDKQRGDSAA